MALTIEDKLGIGVVGIVLISAIGSIAVAGGLIYIAFHFIHKIW